MLENKFNKMKEETPYVSDLMIFNSLMVLINKKLDKSYIRKCLKKLVDKEDYKGDGFDKIVDYAISINNKRFE